jgi:type II secretory pathway pseudopilin PulG
MMRCLHRHRRHRHRAARAFTISELLIAIGILAIVGLVATQVFFASFRVSRATAAQQDAAGSFDSAMSVLRSDVWTAAEIAAPDASTAKLGKVTWRINDLMLTRDAGGDGAQSRTWPMPKGTSFVADGASLVLRVPAATGERGGDVRMISESQLLSRLKPS